MTKILMENDQDFDGMNAHLAILPKMTKILMEGMIILVRNIKSGPSDEGNKRDRHRENTSHVSMDNIEEAVRRVLEESTRK